MTDTSTKKMLRLGWLFLLLPAVSVFMPERLWGLHGWKFLPPSVVIGIWFLAIVLMLMGQYSRSGSWDALSLKGYNITKVGVYLAVISSVIFYWNPIVHDIYGDAQVFLDAIGSSTSGISDIHWELIWDFNIFSPDNGKNSLIALIQVLSYHFEVEHITLFRIKAMIAGGLYVFLWFWFAFQYFTRPSVQWLIVILGLGTAFLLNFFGHVEVYALFIPFFFAHFFTLLLYLKERRSKWILMSAIALLVSLKLHFAAFLAVPSFAFALAMFYDWKKWLPTWDKAWKFVIIPIWVIGIFVYVFVLKDYNDPRYLPDGIAVYERLFLPILSPEAPFDTYSLLHYNHLFDLANMTFLWSLPLLFVLCLLFRVYHQSIDLKSKASVLIGATTIMLLSLFFMINPLAGMTLDWDLFLIAFIPPTAWIIVLLKQVEDKLEADTIIWQVMSLSMFVLAFILVHFNQSALSQRYEAIGRYTFKTNYIRSAFCLDNALSMAHSNPTEYLRRYERVIQDLEPWAHAGFDDNYAFLLMSYAKYLRVEAKDYRKALDYHLRSMSFYPDNPVNILGLTEALFLNKKYEEALLEAGKLVEMEYPNPSKARRIAVQAALEAQRYEEAKRYTETANLQDPNNQVLQTVRDRIDANDRVDSLIYLFNRGQ